VNLIVQPIYKKYIKDDPLFLKNGHTIQCLIGDSGFLSLHQKTGDKTFMITAADHIAISSIKDVIPTYIFKISDIEKTSEPLNMALHKELLDIKKKYKINLAKTDVEQKRSELEHLNYFLKNKSDEKEITLADFHAKELVKKNKEKKLLSFLDYLNSEYEKSDFILEVLKNIWQDIKKTGTFYRLGFVIQSPNDNDKQKIDIVEFDGKIDRAKSISSDNEIQVPELNQFLANVFKRPVGKLISFFTEKDKNKFIFFFEAQAMDYDIIEIEAYMLDRISLLSIVMQKWYAESAEIKLLNQWQHLFKSYKNPIHVIDQDYKLIQSNYAHGAEYGVKKCYQILALRDSPCLNCPLLLKTKESPKEVKNLVSIQGEEFEIINSEFSINKQNYFFMIYENENEISLLKSDMIQAEKMSTIGQLSNHLAHELNNPLTGLKLYAEMLLSEHRLVSPVYENDMNEVLKAISRSQIILQDLKQFANEDQTELVGVDISEIIKKTMTLLKSVLRNRRIFIDLKPTEILAQPNYLQQVLFNLIKNSCQAMDDKGTLKVYQIESDRYFDFIIEDNGPGLPPQILNQMFKPFFTTKQVGQGTGLGLFISQKLMRRMNADLIFNSKFNKGTQFILRFNK